MAGIARTRRTSLSELKSVSLLAQRSLLPGQSRGQVGGSRFASAATVGREHCRPPYRGRGTPSLATAPVPAAAAGAGVCGGAGSSFLSSSWWSPRVSCAAFPGGRTCPWGVPHSPMRTFPGAAAAAAAAVAAGAAAGAAMSTVAVTSSAAAAGNFPSASLLPWVSALRKHASSYYQLSKTKLSLLVVATAGAGFVMGSGETVDWSACARVCSGTFLAAASANTFNQILEVHTDARMKRTMRRPLPMGRISRVHALLWACASGAAGTALLLPPPGLAQRGHGRMAGPPTKAEAETPSPGPSPTPPLLRQPQPQPGSVCGSASVYTPAALAAANIVLYAGLYTPLKQVHVINTWVGALVGAIPPLIGWSAASAHGLASLPQAAGAWLWAAVLFLWQMPHFFALSWLCREDYARGGYKMLSVVDPTGRRTALAALSNSLLLLPMGVLSTSLGVTTAPFAAEATLLSAGLAASAVPFYRNPSPESARALFRVSLMFLPAYMAAMAAHRIPHTLHDDASQLVSSALLEAAAKKHEVGQELQPGIAKASERLHPAESGDCSHVPDSKPLRGHVLPPAAYLSAAPFPFLPLPQ